MDDDKFGPWPKWMIELRPGGPLAKKAVPFPGAIRKIDGRLSNTDTVVCVYSTKERAEASIEAADSLAGLDAPKTARCFAVDREEFQSIASHAIGKQTYYYCIDDGPPKLFADVFRA